MTTSRRAFLAVALLTTAASTLWAPLALASNPKHAPAQRSAVHSQDRFRMIDGHFLSEHQAQPTPHVQDPFADLILG